MDQNVKFTAITVLEYVQAYLAMRKWQPQFSVLSITAASPVAHEIEEEY